MKTTTAVLAVLLLVSLTESAVAVPIPNQAPGFLAADVDGNGYFNPGSTLFSVQIFDAGQQALNQPLTFGFYFAGTDVTNSANLIPIFDSTDVMGDQAVVNLNSGIVVDVEESAVQGVFSGAGALGFYVDLAPFGGGNIFSDASLNGGVDWFGASPFLSDPTLFGLTFFDTVTSALVQFVTISSLTPVSASVSVPEPSTWLLFGVGLIGLLSRNSRFRSETAVRR